jgi:hypothetical protein
MLPDTSAPAPEILPSVTVTVELALGSQLPLFVTMVTFQTPSKGCCAKAETLADAANAEAIKSKPTRFIRMIKISSIWVMAALFEANVSKVCCVATVQINSYTSVA